MNGLQTDSNSVETLVAPATGEAGQAIDDNFATLSALITAANALIAELQAAVAALTTNQAAHTVLAGPSSGSPALPTFRALTASDIPTLNQNTTGTASNVTGTVAIANGGTGQASASAGLNALLPGQSGQVGNYLTTDGANASWAAVSSGGPGGVSGQLQYNSSGSFAGDTATTDGSGNLTINSLTCGTTVNYTQLAINAQYSGIAFGGPGTFGPFYLQAVIGGVQLTSSLGGSPGGTLEAAYLGGDGSGLTNISFSQLGGSLATGQPLSWALGQSIYGDNSYNIFLNPNSANVEISSGSLVISMGALRVTGALADGTYAIAGGAGSITITNGVITAVS